MTPRALLAVGVLSGVMTGAVMVGLYATTRREPARRALRANVARWLSRGMLSPVVAGLEVTRPGTRAEVSRKVADAAVDAVWGASDAPPPASSPAERGSPAPSTPSPLSLPAVDDATVASVIRFVRNSPEFQRLKAELVYDVVSTSIVEAL